MDDNIQTNTIGRLTPCLQKKIDKTIYLIAEQEKVMKNDEYVLGK